MSKEAKDLELLPRLSANEKKIFSTLTNFGASTVLEIADHGGLSKGRIPVILDTLKTRGLITQITTKDVNNPRYAAIFPITRFNKVVNVLRNSLEARKSELEATSQLVKNFTENAIKNVREASNEERHKRTERSEEDIKDLEMAMDASFSGILASVEMDLKDLGKIAQTSNEFLVESAIRTRETQSNIKKGLIPLTTNFSQMISNTQLSTQQKLEISVDARVSDVLDFETNANKAFEEVLDAFKDSQNAFEDIIFNVLDTGIEDLEKVTRPINEQIDEAIKSLTVAIQEASNTFQLEILRVLTEQKRPMIAAVEAIRPKATKALKDSLNSQNTILNEQYQNLITVMENHTSIFSDAVEQLVKEFNRKITIFIEQSQEGVKNTKKELRAFEENYKQSSERALQEKIKLTLTTSKKTRDILNKMMEQFINILNHSVARYKMTLGDLVAKLDNEFLNTLENNGTNFQNLVNLINMSLTDPVKGFVKNLAQMTEKAKRDEENFLSTFNQTITQDLLQINQGFQADAKKSEEELEKNVKHLISKFDKKIASNHETLINLLKTSQKNLLETFTNFSNVHDKELRVTTKEVSNLTRKLERWRGDSVTVITHQVNEKINKNAETLSKKVNEVITKIENTDTFSKDEIIKIVKESYQDVVKSFKGFGTTAGEVVRSSLDDITSTLKNDSLSITNRLSSFKQEQDKLIAETKKPSFKLIDDISKDYSKLYRKLIEDITKFFGTELNAFKNSRKNASKAIETILNRRSNKATKEFTSLLETFNKVYNNSNKKTQNALETWEITIAKDTMNLLDQEKTSRATITNLVDKIVRDLSTSVNTTTQKLTANLWEGSEKIFGQASAEINKQEIELNAINESIRNETLKNISELSQLLIEHVDYIEKRTSGLQERQIVDTFEFKSKFITILKEDFNAKLEELERSSDELTIIGEKLTQLIHQIIETETFRSIQELEAQSSGIEGAIFSTVGKITAENTKRTAALGVIGEQAVLGIEERYTENLEKIRQNLTDEVIGRIEEEAKNIETYKDGMRAIGRDHLKIYGDAAGTLNEKLKVDLKTVEKNAMRIFAACESLSGGFLEELNAEINAMGNRVGTSTERLTEEILDDIDRVFQKVKREAALFARKQFELSNKSNHEIAEAFLKAVDDLEEVMLKQITSFTNRTNMAIDRTTEVSKILNEHILDMIESFKEAQEDKEYNDRRI